ncbi:MAG: shikimate dehydrogenase [Syntrophales bacterium]|jgi:shikimate dehydrogenase
MSDRSNRYGLFGNPVAQSLSPLMHRAAYQDLCIQGSYDVWPVKYPREIVRKIREEGIIGASITIPFKEAVREYLDEVDETARIIGSVNTIVNNGIKLKGFNTDWMGLVRGLAEHLEMKGKSFAILGAGGTARSAAFGILREGGTPIIFSRTLARGEDLADALGCRAKPFDTIEGFRSDVLINTTPVGMAPDTGRSPLSTVDLGRFKYVMDVIYNPIQTKLLKDAELAGCHVINGVGMFVHQGAEQIRIWTGMEPPLKQMRQAVERELDRLSV